MRKMIPHSCHSRKRSVSGILLKAKKDSGQAGMTNWLLNTILVVVVVAVLGACSMPDTQIYSLHMSGNPSSSVQQDRGKSGGSGSDASVAVLVSSPRYLTQPYIASRTSPYELTISRYSKWDASPDEMVRQAFSDAFSSSGLFRSVRASNIVPSGYYSIKIYLRHFDRIDEGEASFGEIGFNLNLLSPDGKELYQGAFNKKVRLENRSFVSLAKALSGALSEGMEEAKANVEKSLKR